MWCVYSIRAKRISVQAAQASRREQAGESEQVRSAQLPGKAMRRRRCRRSSVVGRQPPSHSVPKFAIPNRRSERQQARALEKA